jgi:2-amino-4-hydroxy-6-hydroxymethyldihydropteridine diphosphokinase
MATIFISMGSNIEKEENTILGLNALSDLLGCIELSSVFECEPVGFEGDLFLNLVVKANTQLSVKALATALRDIEFKCGRNFNAKKFSSRSLDLDLLLYDDLVLSEPVQIPRDEITKNAFVLWPLSELSDDLIHPISKKTYQQLWQQFDLGQQKIYKIPFTWSPSINI